MYLMGTDIGTQGTKTIIVNERGQLISEAFEEYSVITPKHSWAEQWPNVWVKAVINTIKESFERANINNDEIAGLAISGLYGGSGIPVNKNIDPIYPCLIWMDRRAKAETQWVKDNIPLKKIFGITGNYVDSYYGFTKMMWIKNNYPEIWKDTYQFVTPKDYVIYKLTDDLSTDYSSAGNIGGVFDITRREWSKEMCDLLEIEIEKLPEKIIKSSDIAGKLKKEIAELTGLKTGMPVISGGIDAPVAQFSAGVLQEGEHVAMAGTSMCWGTVHSGKYLTPGLISFPYVVEEDSKIYTFGGSATSGALARWFRDQFGIYEKEVESKTGISAYTLLEMEGRNIPAGSEGVVVLPYFMGERSPIWDPDARGTIFGLSLSHTRSYVYHALLESAAYSLKHNIETGIDAGMKLDPDCWIVGGVAKSSFWVQIFADITGYNMKRLAKDVEAPFGDAFLAGLGTGVFSKPDEIKKWIDFRPLIQVNETKNKEYKKYYEIFLELYKNTKDLMKKI